MPSVEPIKSRPIRIGILGCARISANHFKSIEAHADDLELFAVCDVDPVKLAVADHGVVGHASLEAMFDAKEPDVISICTPSGQHSQQAQSILAAESASERSGGMS